MVTLEQAEQSYRAARAELTEVIWAPQTSPEQREKARAARDVLLNEFLGQVASDIASRTAQFKAFIEGMRALLQDFGAGGPVAAVQRLSAIATEGENLLVVVGKVVGRHRRHSRGVRPQGRVGLASKAHAAGQELRVLAVHGIGDHHTDTSWKERWTQAIVGAVRGVGGMGPVNVTFCEHDAVFEKYPLGVGTTLSALWKLTKSGVTHGLLGRGMTRGDMSGSLRWSAGMIVQWVEEDGLRADLRALLKKRIKEEKPHVVLAHSLGSLIAYDTLAADRNLLAGGTLVSLGSQIGNAFVRGTWGGRVAALDNPGPGPRHWWHLYNRHDHVFTSELRVPDSSGFRQVETPFDAEGWTNHDALCYLTHKEASANVWQTLVAESGAKGLSGNKERMAMVAARAKAVAPKPAPTHRALVIGINAYPDPKDRLEGCVNDAFAVSAMLQELGFKAEGIRMLLDERATAVAIRERLDWLMDGADGTSERVLYYSGHGAQIPGYGANQEVDRIDECLVPHDFDWSLERAITDDEFSSRYSQLPYGARLTAVFDCCHAGGMHRNGGMRARGLTPPDDIRHRGMKWDKERQMWVARDFHDHGKSGSHESERFFGRNGAMRLLGAAGSLRRELGKAFAKTCKDAGHKGPYMPVVVQACGEDELAYEYRHGVESRGAFTYALLQQMRQARIDGKPTSYRELVAKAAKVLGELGYGQKPFLRGPKARTETPMAWLLDSDPVRRRGKPGAKKTRRRKK